MRQFESHFTSGHPHFMKRHQLCLISLSLLAAGCTSYRHPEPTSAKEALTDARLEQQRNAQAQALAVPSSVQNELLALTRPALPTALPEKRLRIAAHDVEAVDFFGSLFKGSRYSVAVHPGVAGLISLELKDVTLPEVLAVTADMYGYDVQRKGYVYHIYPAGLRTETIPVNYLMMARRGQSRTAINTGGVTANDPNNSGNNNNFDSGNNSNSSNGSGSSRNSDSQNGTQIETDTNTDYWTDLKDSLQTLIGKGEGRAVITSPQAGLVTLRAYPKELKAVREFLTQSESHLKRQVVLEARILEVALNEGYEQGVDWNGLSATWDGGSKGVTGIGSLVGNTVAASTNTIFKALGGGAGFTISDGNFDVAVNLLKTQGDVNTLSSPRVTATNNQKAVIKVGTDEYFVTDASTTITSSSNQDQVYPNVELTPFFSGIALDVTPQIDEQNRVLLHVHPSVIDTQEQQKTISVGTANPLVLPLAKSSIRESDTVVQANDGDIIVIGGLMETKKQEIVSKVPLLGDIPWIGEAFTNRSESTRKVELVILLKPTVVDKDTWQKELQRSSELLDKWYPSRDQ
jgi:MSHA biogenesis protein MshL